MIPTKDYFLEYFSSFFTDDEKLLFQTRCPSDNYTKNYTEEWNNLKNDLVSLALSKSLNIFNMSIAPTASYFIDKLFELNIDDNTFVISPNIHKTVIENTDTVLHKYILTYNDIEKLAIDKIINAYKQSDCKRIFVYLAGLVEQKVITLDFCFKLKEELVKQNIEHLLILDDVGTMFILPKDYSVFDYIVFTCHSLVPNFDTGILFHKNNIDFGFTSINIMKAFIPALKLILNKKDKLLIFNYIMYQFFAEELSDDLFTTLGFTTPNIFTIISNNKNITRLLNRYTDELKDKYKIACKEDCINIRGCGLLSQNQENIMIGLNKVKQLLKRCIEIKNRQ